MQTAQSYAARYQATQVQTADQLELLLILYKSAIAQIRSAKKHLFARDIPARVAALNKAISLIGELQSALDFERGGSIAVSLDRLYLYMFQRLTVANARAEVEPLDEVVKLLETLEGAWEQARASRPPVAEESFSAKGRLARAG